MVSQERLAKALKGKTYSAGGLNAPDLIKIAKTKYGVTAKDRKAAVKAILSGKRKSSVSRRKSSASSKKPTAYQTQVRANALKRIKLEDAGKPVPALLRQAAVTKMVKELRAKRKSSVSRRKSSSAPKRKSSVSRRKSSSAPKRKSSVSRRKSSSAPKRKSSVSRRKSSSAPKRKSSVSRRKSSSAPKRKSSVSRRKSSSAGKRKSSVSRRKSSSAGKRKKRVPSRHRTLAYKTQVKNNALKRIKLEDEGKPVPAILRQAAITREVNRLRGEQNKILDTFSTSSIDIVLAPSSPVRRSPAPTARRSPMAETTTTSFIPTARRSPMAETTTTSVLPTARRSPAPTARRSPMAETTTTSVLPTARRSPMAETTTTSTMPSPVSRRTLSRSNRMPAPPSLETMSTTELVSSPSPVRNLAPASSVPPRKNALSKSSPVRSATVGASRKASPLANPKASLLTDTESTEEFFTPSSTPAKSPLLRRQGNVLSEETSTIGPVRSAPPKKNTPPKSSLVRSATVGDSKKAGPKASTPASKKASPKASKKASPKASKKASPKASPLYGSPSPVQGSGSEVGFSTTLNAPVKLPKEDQKIAEELAQKAGLGTPKPMDVFQLFG